MYFLKYLMLDKINHPRFAMTKAFLKTSSNLQGNTCVGFCFNKIAAPRKKETWHRCFLVNLRNLLGHLHYRTTLTTLTTFDWPIYFEWLFAGVIAKLLKYFWTSLHGLKVWKAVQAVASSEHSSGLVSSNLGILWHRCFSLFCCYWK